MVSKLDVRIVELQPMRMASVQGFGQCPEELSQKKLLAWARSHNLLGKSSLPRFFGFNNPDPTPASPNYGYEFWMAVGEDVKAEGEIQIKSFTGGLYAVMRCKNPMTCPDAWKQLVQWLETSPYHKGDHQWLEEHMSFIDLPVEEILLDLYLPIQKA